MEGEKKKKARNIFVQQKKKNTWKLYPQQEKNRKGKMKGWMREEEREKADSVIAN